MKILCVLLLLLATALTATAQPGKPIYRIDVEQGGSPFGSIDIELWPDIAPLHVRNFDSLVAIGFYDSLAFHRVIPEFMIQGGDPNSRSGPESSWGMGDPSQTTVPAEFSPVSHRRGILSAARKGGDVNSATSQFFIVVRDSPGLDGDYSVYGKVIAGMETADSIVNVSRNSADRPLVKIEMFVSRTGIDTSISGAPVLTFPATDTNRVGGSISLRWEPVVGAVLYEVQLSRDPDFTEIVLAKATTEPRLAAPVIVGLNRYYWRVRASNGGRSSDFSEVRTFTTRMAAPTLASPRGGDTVTSPVILRWSPVAGASSYTVQIGGTLGINPVLFEATALTDTFLMITDELEYGKLHFWRVLALSNTDTTPSARWSFTPVAPLGVETDLDARAASIAVRIERDVLSVDLDLKRASNVRLTLVDVRGVARELMTSTPVPPGRRSFRFDVGSLSSGSRLVEAMIDDERVTRLVQVVR